MVAAARQTRLDVFCSKWFKVQVKVRVSYEAAHRGGLYHFGSAVFVDEPEAREVFMEARSRFTDFRCLDLTIQVH
jgi:hypothetical protein